jgi:hypothetical protein
MCLVCPIHEELFMELSPIHIEVLRGIPPAINPSMALELNNLQFILLRLNPDIIEPLNDPNCLKCPNNVEFRVWLPDHVELTGSVRFDHWPFTLVALNDLPVWPLKFCPCECDCAAVLADAAIAIEPAITTTTIEAAKAIATFNLIKDHSFSVGVLFSYL